MQLTKLQIFYLCINLSSCFIIHNHKNILRTRHIKDEDYEMTNIVQKKVGINTNIDMAKNKGSITKENEITSKQDELLNDDMITLKTKDTARRGDEMLEYNYNDLLQEYYLQSAEDRKSNNQIENSEPEKNVIETIQKLLFLDKLSSNCTEEEVKGFGIKALKCVIQDYKYKRQPLSVTTERAWRIIKLWFILYFLVALPIWFTGGWCCCCLCCKIFKPHKTIHEARNYLLTNPPGIFRDKYGETRYLPSEKEKEKYEEFEHLLRII